MTLHILGEKPTQHVLLLVAWQQFGVQAGSHQITHAKRKQKEELM